MRESSLPLLSQRTTSHTVFFASSAMITVGQRLSCRVTCRSARLLVWVSSSRCSSPFNPFNPQSGFLGRPREADFSVFPKEVEGRQLSFKSVNLAGSFLIGELQTFGSVDECREQAACDPGAAPPRWETSKRPPVSPPAARPPAWFRLPALSPELLNADSAEEPSGSCC